MSNIPETNLTLEQVLPAYFKLIQELEESRNVNQRLIKSVDKHLAASESKSNVLYSITGKISDICWEYNTGGISDKIAFSRFLELEEVVNAI